MLGLDDYRGTHFPANVPRELAPFTDIAGIGFVPEAAIPETEWSDDPTKLTLYAEGRSGPSPNEISRLPATGKANAQRTGGKLRPVTVKSTPPRKRTPVRRCALFIVGTIKVNMVGATAATQMILRSIYYWGL